MAKVRPARRGRPRKPAPVVARRQPRGNAVATVDAIVIAAERVLERHGLDGLTTNQIAEIAGVSVGSVYQYFSNRDAIIAELYRRYIARYAQVLPRVLAEHAALSLPDLLARIADALIDVYDAQPPIHHWMWRLRAATSSDEPIVRQLDETAGLVASAIAAKNLSGVDARTLAFVIVHTIDGAANAVANRPGTIDPRAVGRVVAHMIGGYLTSLGWR